MSKIAVEYILELLGVGGIVALIAFVSWTKLTLGGVLTVLGAYFPSLQPKTNNVAAGNTQIKVWNIFLKMSGTLRFGVVVAGLLVLVGAILDAHKGYVADSANRLQSRLPLRPGVDPVENMRLQLQQLRKGKPITPLYLDDD
jgi:hypothetical protein